MVRAPPSNPYCDLAAQQQLMNYWTSSLQTITLTWLRNNNRGYKTFSPQSHALTRLRNSK